MMKIEHIPKYRRPRKKSYIRRFEEKYLKYLEDDCWPWNASCNNKGYGNFWDNDLQRNEIASRVSYTLYKGTIPHGGNVLHKCDNPLCVNPKHLYIGTKRDNAADRVRRGRQPNGSKIHCAKLREGDIEEIRKLVGIGFTQVEIARDLGVSISAINKVVKNKTWRHV